MSPSQMLYNSLKEAGVNFYVTLPCKLLQGLIGLVETDGQVISTPVTREEEGVGILAGAALAGRRPAIVMQNSGLGNSINAICSLLCFYKLSVVFVVSHRGSPGESIAAQRPMGEATPMLFKTLGVPCHQLTSVADLGILVPEIDRAVQEHTSVAFLLPFSFWNG